MKSLTNYIIYILLIVSKIANPVFAMSPDEERAEKSKYLTYLYRECDKKMPSEECKCREKDQECGEDGILEIRPFLKDEEAGYIEAGDHSFAYKIHFINEGSFGQVYEIAIKPSSENFPRFSVIAKAMVKVKECDVAKQENCGIADKSIQKIIMNSRLLQDDPEHFIGYLGLIRGKVQVEAQDKIVPVILLEKGESDLNSLFIKPKKPEEGKPAVKITRSYLNQALVTSSKNDYIKVQDSENKVSLYYLKDFLNDMIDGIAFMHGKNLAHFDIKPANMLLGLNGKVKIIDTDGAVEVSGPAVKSPVGLFTRAFAAPEMFRNHLSSFERLRYLHSLSLPAIDWLKSDVYALGMSILSIVTGWDAAIIFLWGLDCINKDMKSVKNERICVLPATKAKDPQANALQTKERNSYIAKGKIVSTLKEKPLPIPGITDWPLYKIILKMLEADPEKRLSIEEVKAEIGKLYPRG